MSIRDTLLLTDHEYMLGTVVYRLRRPSALDLIEALEVSKNEPSRLHAWLVLRHLVENGKPVFENIEQVLACDAAKISLLAQAAEKMYAEGRD